MTDVGGTGPTDTLAAEGFDRQGSRMFERFTDRARRVLVLAQEEARLLNHSFIASLSCQRFPQSLAMLKLKYLTLGLTALLGSGAL